MKEQLVEFSTAKLAKEKGFGLGENDYCQLPYYYNLEGKLNDIKDNLFKRDISTTHLGALTLDNVEIGILFMDNSLDEYTLAPTQSLLHRWLREVHNLHIWLQPLGYKMQYDVYIEHIDDWKKGEENTCVGEDFNTYEKALEKGLQEALKLIKQQL